MKAIAALLLLLICPAIGLGWAGDTLGYDPRWPYAVAKFLLCCSPVFLLLLRPESKQTEAPP